MADDKAIEHGGDDIDRGDAEKGQEQSIVSVNCHVSGFCERVLYCVVECAEPIINHDIELNLEPGHENDDRRHHHRPQEPAMR